LFGKWRGSIKVLLVLLARVFFPPRFVLGPEAIVVWWRVAEVCHLKSLSCRIQFDRKYCNKVLYHLSEKLWRKTVLSSREFNTQTSSERCKLYTFRNFILVVCTYYIAFRKVYNHGVLKPRQSRRVWWCICKRPK